MLAINCLDSRACFEMWPHQNRPELISAMNSRFAGAFLDCATCALNVVACAWLAFAMC